MPKSKCQLVDNMKNIVRRKAGDFVGPKPEILAPAGNKEAFLAALAV
jgi:hypothetical protein